MKVSELASRTQRFHDDLEAHFELWQQSLEPPLPDYPVRNTEELRRQMSSLARQLGTLRPYIVKLTQTTRMGMMGQPHWDIYDSAVSNDLAARKGPSIEAILPQLQQMIGRLESLDPESDLLMESGTQRKTLQEIKSSDTQGSDAHFVQLADSFHRVVLRLRTRHAERPPFLINDEYDVQDIFAALLETRFEDIRREEWGPSYAGGATRADFLLKNESVLFETKMMREGLNDRKLGEELIIDIEHYKQRPHKALVCFVYDPEHRLKNPRGLENDLSKRHNSLDVRVVIRPKS
jgi:hypothetical protein